MNAFDQVCTLLPPELRRGAQTLPPLVARRVEEIRLRAGRSPTVTIGGDELPLPGNGPVTVRDLERTLEIATQASAHAALERVRQGYFTVRGGHLPPLVAQAHPGSSVGEQAGQIPQEGGLSAPRRSQEQSAEKSSRLLQPGQQGRPAAGDGVGHPDIQ